MTVDRYIRPGHKIVRGFGEPWNDGMFHDFVGDVKIVCICNDVSATTRAGGQLTLLLRSISLRASNKTTR